MGFINLSAKDFLKEKIFKCFLFICKPDLLTHLFIFVLGYAAAQQLKNNQEDPCQTKARVVGDSTYCDRYWECVNGQPELYDCPNGLVFAGKNRGVTEGCDYPWRSTYCVDKQQASELHFTKIFLVS